MKQGYQRSPKAKVSAAIFPWTIAALDRLRKERGLRSRSEAVAEALAEWAADYRKAAMVEEAVKRYGPAYAKIAAQEEEEAMKHLPISLRHGAEP